MVTVTCSWHIHVHQLTHNTYTYTYTRHTAGSKLWQHSRINQCRTVVDQIWYADWHEHVTCVQTRHSAVTFLLWCSKCYCELKSLKSLTEYFSATILRAKSCTPVCFSPVNFWAQHLFEYFKPKSHYNISCTEWWVYGWPCWFCTSSSTSLIF